MKNKLLVIIKTLFKLIFHPKIKDWRRLQFYRYSSNMRWYVQLRWWPFKKDYLEMVSGSADFLDSLIEGCSPCDYRKITLHFKYSNKPLNVDDSFECIRVNKKLFKGAFYKVNGLNGFKSKLYLCPVTLFVLGHYPKYIYIDQNYQIIGRSGKRYNTSVSN